MWNRKRAALIALVALGAWACTPDEYPTEPRFEAPPEEVELPDGELFYYAPPAGVSVTAVSLRGPFNEWGETAMIELPDGRWVAGVELEPGTYEYKYFFRNAEFPDGDWASNMCNDPRWGDPANGGKVDAEVTECLEGGNGLRQVGTPGHTFLYIVPDSVDVEVVTVAGSFQDPVWTNDTDTLTNIWELTVDMEPGTYEYKYVFNDGDWAEDMCNETQWGDPAIDMAVDPDNPVCVAGGGNGTITIDAAGPHTFRYIVPAGADSISTIHVAGSFQDPAWNNASPTEQMTETFQRRYDMAPGTYEYKFIFDGTWALNMCTNDTWAGGGMVDANGSGTCNGENAVIVIE